MKSSVQLQWEAHPEYFNKLLICYMEASHVLIFGKYFRITSLKKGLLFILREKKILHSCILQHFYS